MIHRFAVASALVAFAAALAVPAGATPRGTLAQIKASRERSEMSVHQAGYRAPKHPGFIPRSVRSYRVAWRNGVTESALAPLPAEIFKVTNQWSGEINGRHVNVYAGAYRRDPSQGFLVVLSSSFDGTSVSAPQIYKTNGAARIVAAMGTQLAVLTGSGKTLHFTIPTALPVRAGAPVKL